jgi:hypothetical protein
MIIKNSNYIIKSQQEIQNLIKNQEYQKKIKYYKQLSNRIYSNTIKIKNKNYDKPCLNFINKKSKKSDDDYGYIFIYGKKESSHRVSYALYNNIFVEDIPKINEFNEMLEICHGHGCSKCCIEPTHLALKTKSKNCYEDKIRDNTLLRGNNHPSSKITELLATQIKQSKGDGGTQKQRSIDFKVSLAIIQSIDRGSSWFHIPYDKDKNICNNLNTRKQTRNQISKDRTFTSEEYKEALEIIKIKSKKSELINNKNVKTKCWLFTGKLEKNGYGRIRFKGARFLIHVLAYEAKNGKRYFTNKKKYICHKCNVKFCCNPEHLYFGTSQENGIDARKNGQKGIKITEDDVKKIKVLLKEGKLTQKEIGKLFNVSARRISSIHTERNWKDIN